jgi:hypothetical protein
MGRLSSILDPGGGVALFPADRSSEEVTACVAELLSSRLPNVRIAAGPEASGIAFGGVAESAPPSRPGEYPLPDPLQPEARTLLIPTHARAHGSAGTVAVFLIPIPFFAFTESRVCHTMGSQLGELFGGVRAAE